MTFNYLLSNYLLPPAVLNYSNKCMHDKNKLHISFWARPEQRTRTYIVKKKIIITYLLATFSIDFLVEIEGYMPRFWSTRPFVRLSCGLFSPLCGNWLPVLDSMTPSALASPAVCLILVASGQSKTILISYWLHPPHEIFHKFFRLLYIPLTYRYPVSYTTEMHKEKFRKWTSVSQLRKSKVFV